MSKIATLPITNAINKTDNGNGTFRITLTFTDRNSNVIGTSAMDWNADASGVDLLYWINNQAVQAITNAFNVSDIPSGITTLTYNLVPQQVRAIDSSL